MHLRKTAMTLMKRSSPGEWKRYTMPYASRNADLPRLEDILHILQSKQVESQSNNGDYPDIPQRVPVTKESQNRFASLSSMAAIYENDTVGEDTTPTTKMGEDRHAKNETIVFGDRFVFEDDDLGEWIDLTYFIYSLDAILDQSNKYWMEAANGTLPICLSAWLSSTAFYEVGRRYEKFDYDTLLPKWARYRMKPITIQFKDTPGLQSGTRRFTDLIGLISHGDLLRHYRTSPEHTRIAPKAGGRESPTELIAPISQDNSQFSLLDRLAMDRMLEHMRQLLATKRAIAAIETPVSPQPVCEPLLPFISRVFCEKELPIPMQLIFGMEILLSSYKAYTWPDGVLNNRNCRTLVLHFALEVKESFSEAKKWIQRRTESASVHNLPYLQSVFDGLEAYTREVRFDLYYQAPWTTGCHIVEILTVAMFEGLHLCCDTGYLCALLHLYNALRSIDSNFRQIKLLDQLCEIFRDKLFLGVFPTENFSSHFRRAMGGQLRRKADTHLISRLELSRPIPGMSMRKTGSTRLSNFYDLHTFGYEPSADFWHLNFEGKARWQPTTQREQDEAIRRAYTSPLTLSLEKIKENVAQEFGGPLPVARINYLAVFLFGANSMEELCKSFTAVKEQIFQPDCDLGFGVVDDLLVQIVDHQRDIAPRLLLPYWRPVNNAKNFFNGLDGKLSLDQFLWKSAI